MNIKPWLVLLATDPKRAEFRLAQQNMLEEQGGRQPSFSMFVPYTYMSPDGSGDGLSKESFSLRSALHRYLFVKGDDNLLGNLLREWNRTSDDKMFFLHDASRHNARISQNDMDKLITACGSEQVRLDMPLLLSDLKPGQNINLANTPFESKDATYKILSVKHRKGGIVELQVELSIFNVKFQNLFVTYLEPVDRNSNASLVATANKKILDIFRRKVNRKNTEVSDYEDLKTLRSLFDKRDTPFPDGAMKRHFLALMLICAHLLGDEEATQQFIEAVSNELSDISRLRESKAATDTRAYLHIALYIATGEPKYRDLAKSYVKKYSPDSQYLCQFVSTSAKRQAIKFLGPASRRI